MESINVFIKLRCLSVPSLQRPSVGDYITGQLYPADIQPTDFLSLTLIKVCFSCFSCDLMHSCQPSYPDRIQHFLLVVCLLHSSSIPIEPVCLKLVISSPLAITTLHHTDLGFLRLLFHSKQILEVMQDTCAWLLIFPVLKSFTVSFSA